MKTGVLAQRHSVKGRMYGPGVVDLADSVHDTLKRRGAFDHPLAEFPQLVAAGYTSIEDARAMDDSVLLKIEGVGPATVKRIRGEADDEPPAPSVPRFIGKKSDGAEKQD